MIFYFSLFLISLFFVLFTSDIVFATPSALDIQEGYVQVYQFALDWITDFYMLILSFFSFVGVLAFWLKTYR